MDETNNKDIIQKAVSTFREETGFGRSINDAFVPWWISYRFSIDPTIAMRNSSDGSGDFGVDGYYFEIHESFATIYFIQGKYTSDINLMKSGITDFSKQRFILKLQSLLRNDELDNPNTNDIIKRLFSEYTKIKGKTISISFIVLTLSDEDPEYINKRFSNSQKDTIKEIQQSIGINIQIGGISVLTTKNILADKVKNHKDRYDTISFDGSSPIVMDESKFFSGLGKLCDLVDLYKEYGNHLFERNVRFYLFGKKNEDHGPAGKMKQTLASICIEKTSAPTRFAFLHNGVTIFAETVTINSITKQIVLKSPCILNGCQTIKASYFFLQSKRESQRFSEDIWNSIPITIRVVVSTDNRLWRDVAESNNRQNALRPSALKANDENQIKLEHLFKKYKIFYERQEGAFKNISTTSPVLISSEYHASSKEPIRFEKLGRALVVASELPIYLFNSIHAVFETDEFYEKLYNQQTITDDNIPYFVLLNNIQKVIHLSLKEIVNESGENGKYGSMNISRFQATIFRLLIKTIDAREERGKLIEDFGYSIISSNISKESIELRLTIKTILRSKEYPIMQIVAEVYKKNNEWQEPFDATMNQKAQKKLGVENIKCF